jgi:hypothetical protein
VAYRHRSKETLATTVSGAVVPNPEPTLMVPGPVATRSTHQFEVWEMMAAMVEPRPDVHNEPRSGAWWQQQSWQMVFEKPHDQGLQSRWEPVRFGRFPVEPVRPGTRTGPVPTPKPWLYI